MSFVSSRDEFVAAKAVERAVQSPWALPGLARALPAAPVLPARCAGLRVAPRLPRRCRGGAGAAGGAAPQERAFTTLLYLSDNASGDTDFPTLRASIKPRAGRFVAWRSLENADRDPASTHAAGPVLVTDAPKLVLQRWYERAPYLPGPNAHGEPSTRCSLGEDGSVDSCRTYCASQRARAASDALRFGMEAFTAHKSGQDPGRARRPSKHYQTRSLCFRASRWPRSCWRTRSTTAPKLMKRASATSAPGSSPTTPL